MQVRNITVPDTVGTDFVSVNAANFDGLTNFINDRSSNATLVTNLATGAGLTVVGNGALAGGEVAFGYAAATDAVTLNLRSGTNMTAGITARAAGLGGTATGTATTVTVNSTGAANTVGTVDLANATITSATINATTALTGDLFSQATDQVGAAGTLAITGAGAVNLTAALDNTITTITATTHTGGLTATLGTGLTSATFGSGADVITTADLASDNTTINGGTGSDILIIAAAADVNTATEAADYVGFETVRLGNVAVDMSLFTGSTVTAIQKTAGGDATTGLNATQAAAITLRADDAGSTFALASAAGAADVLAITSANTTAAVSADLTNTTITGFETLNFTVSSGDADLATNNDRTVLSFGAAGDLTSLNVRGGFAATVTASANAAALTNIDASANTAGVAIATGGQTGALVVTGSDAIDTITLNAVGAGGTVSVNGGAGNDTITTTQAIAAASTLVGGIGADTLAITDAPATTAALTIADSTFVNVSGIETVSFTGAIAGDLTWALGGYANALASANSGRLSISATAIATVVAGDDITIDASALAGTNAVTMTITDTSAAADQASDISLTGGGGNDIITATEVTAASDVIITLTGNGGADTLTVVTSATHDGAFTALGGAGNDTIDVSGATSDAATSAITGGAGNDTIILDTEGANTVVTVVFAATAALNGADTITNFAIAGDIINWAQGDAETDAAAVFTVSANDMYQLGGQVAGSADSAAAVAAAMNAAGTITAAVATTTAWITISDNNSTSIWQWVDVGNVADEVNAAELTLVGTIDAAMTTAQIATATTIV